MIQNKVPVRALGVVSDEPNGASDSGYSSTVHSVIAPLQPLHLTRAAAVNQRSEDVFPTGVGQNASTQFGAGPGCTFSALAGFSPAGRSVKGGRRFSTN